MVVSHRPRDNGTWLQDTLDMWFLLCRLSFLRSPASTLRFPPRGDAWPIAITVLNQISSRSGAVCTYWRTPPANTDQPRGPPG